MTEILTGMLRSYHTPVCIVNSIFLFFTSIFLDIHFDGFFPLIARLKSRYTDFNKTQNNKHSENCKHFYS